MNVDGNLINYCITDTEEKVITLGSNGSSGRRISDELGISERHIRRLIKRVKERAELKGYCPEKDMTKTVPDSFSVSGVSSYYNKDGDLAGQWVKSSISKEDQIRIAFELFKDGLVEDLSGKYKKIEPPTEKKNKDRAAAYIVGDHHLGLQVWSPETGDDNYDIEISKTLLFNAVDTLAELASDASTGILVNLGDFMHANNLKNETGSGNHTLDVDTRMGKAIQAVGQLYKRIVSRMLEVHDEVWIVNVRGNHDPDASLWLNEMVKMYWENEPRVKILDNYNKFIWFEWGENLVVLHHGDKVSPQRLLENISGLLYKQWGRCRHRVCWTGHIHHKQALELGRSMTVESWNVLPPADSYHAEHGYGASRSMSCVILDKNFGEHSRFKVGIDQIR